MVSTTYLPQYDNGDGISLLLKGGICILLMFPVATYLPRLVNIVCERPQEQIWWYMVTNLLPYISMPSYTLHTTLCLLGYMIRFSYFLDVIRISGKEEKILLSGLEKSSTMYIFQFKFSEEQNSEIIFVCFELCGMR